MPFVSFIYNMDGSTAARFNDLSSIFSVLAILSSFLLLSKIRLPLSARYASYLALTGLVFSGNVYVLSYINTRNTLFTQNFTIYKFALAFVEAFGAITVLSVLYQLVSRADRVLDWSDKIEKAWDGVTIYQLDQVVVNGWNRLRTWLRTYRPELVFGVLLYLLAFVSLMAMNLSWTLTLSTAVQHHVVYYTFLVRQTMILVNLGIFLLFYAFFRGLTNRFWVSSCLTTVFFGLFTIASRLKMETRGEPIMPSEAKMFSAYGSLITMVDQKLVVGLCLLVLGMVSFVLYLEWKRPRKKLTKQRRLGYILLPLLALSSVFFLNHKGGIVNTISVGLGNNPMFYNQAVASQINGPTVQFLNNLDIKVMDQPEGYSPERMQAIAQKYQMVAEEINQTRPNRIEDQTVIFNLSESFFDPYRLSNIKAANDPIPYIRSILQSPTTSGTMISSGYGGGTANMEFMTLTGFTLSNFAPTLVTPYTQLVTSLDQAPSFNQLFPSSSAIHTYYGVYYSRISVYKKFGFEKFLYDGSKDELVFKEKIDQSNYISDRSAYQNVLELIKATDQGQFVNLISMQNHFPYNLDIYEDTTSYEASGGIIINDDVKKNATNFMTGLAYTDQAVQEYIEAIDVIEKPITLFFYGDHLPGIFPLDPLNQGLLMHSTDYFIYSNRYAREHGALDLNSDDIKTVGPNDFIALVLKQTNSKVDAYGALLTRVQEQLPAMSSSTSSTSNQNNAMTQFTDSNGMIVLPEQFSEEQRQLLEDYLLVQYDMTTGNQYLADLDFMAAYLASSRQK